MSLGATLRRFKTERVQKLPAQIKAETIREFSTNLVSQGGYGGPWTPFGNAELWKSPPPADYRPGNLQSSWFLSVGTPSTEKTEATDHRAVHNLDRLTTLKAGEAVYLSNSADHASSIEGGHSSQAPVGIMTVGQAEFSPMAYAVARRIAG